MLGVKSENLSGFSGAKELSPRQVLPSPDLGWRGGNLLIDPMVFFRTWTLPRMPLPQRIESLLISPRERSEDDAVNHEAATLATHDAACAWTG